MGKTGRWIRNFLFLTGKKEHSKEKEFKIQNQPNDGNEHCPTTPMAVPTTPKEKRRWSFRRSSATATERQESSSMDHNAAPPADQLAMDINDSRKHHALAVADLVVATAAAADAALAAAKAAAAVIQLTGGVPGWASAVEEAAAIKIQSVFRAHLARKALNALRGLVKLQALVRGHLVRKLATATSSRSMQALITVQARDRARARARAQRIRRMADEDQRQNNHRKSTQENWFTNSNQDYERGLEENIKIVEMDLGDYKPAAKARNSYSIHTQPERTTEHRISTHKASVKQENHHHISPAPSAITDMSPRTGSNHFEEYSYATAQSRPQCYYDMSKNIPFPDTRSEYGESLYSEYPFYPNYMANTESSKAKVRSHSAPKSRPVETMERQSSRRRPSLEGRNVPRSVRMQRSSSSQVGSSAQNYQFPWSVKLDKSSVSLKGSECGSTSTVLTNTNYSRALVGSEARNQG